MGETNTNIRVEFLSNGQVDVIHWGMEALFPDITDRYTFTDDLPQWLQERVAILAMTKEPWPTTVADVGTRISENVFWLDTHELEREVNNDTRKES